MTKSVAVAMIVTSHASMGNGEVTGVWFEEVTAPYYAFLGKGARVEIFSIKGGAVPIDPRSRLERGKNPASVERFMDDAEAMQKLEHSRPITSLDVSDYDVLFMPGGHGTMWDFPGNPDLSKRISKAWTDGKVVAAVCHGPAALVGPVDDKGNPLVAGRRVSAFTDSEERAVGLDKTVPFMLETRLRELGARFEVGTDFTPFAVRDGRLVTGQNPMSSEKVAHLVMETVGEERGSTAAPRVDAER